MANSAIYKATEYARKHIKDGAKMPDILSYIQSKWPDVDARKAIMLAGGWVEGWDEKKGTVRKRGRVGA